MTLSTGVLARRVVVRGVVVRGVVAAVVGPIIFKLLVEPWRAAEAWTVVAVLRIAGVDTTERIGSQILVMAPGERPFLANVGSLCSSLGVVLVFIALPIVLTRDSVGRRVKAVATGAAIVVGCNLMRIAATVIVGLRSGPGAIEGFHDGPATAFAVASVLVGLGVVVFRSLPGRIPCGEKDVRILSTSTESSDILTVRRRT